MFAGMFGKTANFWASAKEKSDFGYDFFSKEMEFLVG
jgi:hypothetical protein